MFCKNCGVALPDDAKFCAACGAVISDEGVTQTQPAPAQNNMVVANFISRIKAFWSNPIATVGVSAKSNTHEWLLIAIIGIISYALGTAVVGAEMISQLVKSIIGSFAGSLDIGGIYPFFAIFGIGLLISTIAYFATALGVWILVAKIFKKNVSVIQAFNMTATASLPLIVINILNMLIGLIYSPLTLILFIAAFAMATICIYTGTQKLDKLEKSPFYGYSVILTIVILTVCLLGMLYFSAIVDGIKSYATSAVSGVLGNIFGSSGGLGNILSMFN